jgi:hypothetical protein
MTGFPVFFTRQSPGVANGHDWLNAPARFGIQYAGPSLEGNVPKLLDTNAKVPDLDIRTI